jgi:diphosphomevalonate decarboxylase
MDYRSSWRSPSNIALVKYWGKHGIQLPRNPSLSLTLSECHTNMTVEVDTNSATPGLMVRYNGQPKPSFVPKIEQLFAFLTETMPWLTKASIEIDSINTFPKAAGIASSASAMSALALCLTDIDDQLKHQVVLKDAAWWRRVSTIARLGSGSACRSVFPKAALWGKTNYIADSSDEYAIPYEDVIAPIYRTMHDTILIISANEKSVSSTAGHALMNELAYAETRYLEAKKNITRLIDIMRIDDLIADFIAIVESEALQIHALMMACSKPYLLIEPNTVAVIKEVWKFRSETGIPVCFTLDAGPNVHILYPAIHKLRVMSWIQNQLVYYCASGNYIMDEVGDGPVQLL